ncbi:hypothetical protein LINGRAHAP2_LOCUS4347 [Linum grandiflorum]
MIHHLNKQGSYLKIDIIQKSKIEIRDGVAAKGKNIVARCRYSPGRITDVMQLKSTTQEIVDTLEAMDFGSI